MGVITSDFEGEILEQIAKYMSNQKKSLTEEMIYNLCSDNDRLAAVAAARITELEQIKTIISDAFEEQRKANGDEPSTEPTRYF